MSRASNLAGFTTSITSTTNLNAGIITATSFVGSLTGNITGTASTASFATTSFGLSGSPNITVANLNATGVSTFAGIATHTASLFGTQASFTGVVTASSFRGDGSQLTGVVSGVELKQAGSSVGTAITQINFASGATLTSASSGVSTVTIAAGGSGEFNTGITSTRQLFPLSYESTMYTFPSTAGKRYIIESINVANVSTANTEVNIIGAIKYADNTNHVHFAYNIPIVSGGSVELLKQPHIANPSDYITMWTTGTSYIGITSAVDVYMTFTEQSSTDYFGVGFSTVGLALTSMTGIFTSTTYPSVIQSIHLTNRKDDADYPVSVSITNGTTTSFLAKDLVIPRYSTVELCDRPKRLEIGGIVKVGLGTTSTIDISVSGKKIT